MLFSYRLYKNWNRIPCVFCKNLEILQSIFLKFLFKIIHHCDNFDFLSKFLNIKVNITGNLLKTWILSTFLLHVFCLFKKFDYLATAFFWRKSRFIGRKYEWLQQHRQQGLERRSLNQWTLWERWWFDLQVSDGIFQSTKKMEKKIYIDFSFLLRFNLLWRHEHFINRNILFALIALVTLLFYLAISILLLRKSILPQSWPRNYRLKLRWFLHPWTLSPKLIWQSLWL